MLCMDGPSISGISCPGQGGSPLSPHIPHQCLGLNGLFQSGLDLHHQSEVLTTRQEIMS